MLASSLQLNTLSTMKWPDTVASVPTQNSLEKIRQCRSDVHLADKGTDFRAALPKVHVPTLVIHGDRDHSVSADRGREVAKLIPGAEFKLYEGAPHGLMFTHMDRLNADLVAFTKG